MPITNLVTQADLQLLIPEIFVCCAAFALRMIDLFVSEQRRALTHFLGLLILVSAAVLTVRELATAPVMAFSGFFIRDLAVVVRTLSMFAVTALVFIYA